MLLNVLFTVKKQSLSLSGRSLGNLGKNIPGKICEKCELEYDKKLKSPSGQVAYNEKRKKHTNQTPWEEYVAKAVREFCSDIKDVKHDDSNLKAAICLGTRWFKKVIKSKESGEINVELSKSKYRKAAGGRKTTFSDARDVLDDYSVHLMPEFKETLLKRGYVTVILSGGVTGGIQTTNQWYWPALSIESKIPNFEKLVNE